MSRTLFNDGRRLADAGQYQAACSRFEAARRAYASTGVLMNLADCYEKTGRTASAWTTFGEAASVATRANREGDALDAKRRQAALEPRQTRIAIRVTRDVPGLVVKRDGTEVPAAAWDAAIPVDPGTHEVRAEAPDHETWKGSVLVSSPGQTMTVTVPELRDAPATGPQTREEPKKTVEKLPEQSTGNAQRVVGVLVGGAGLVAMGTGGVIGLVAKAQDNAAAVELGTARHSDSVAAANLGDAATVTVVIGALVAATGVVVWLTAPNARVQVGTNGREFLIGGTF